MDNPGYVAIDLTEESKQMLFDLINQKIPNKDYYQSQDPGYTYINGNVSKKGHLTICYGVKNTNLKEKFDVAKLKINWQKKSKIKNIQINPGYKGLYYIVVAIPEIDKDIYTFDQWIRENNDIVIESFAFDPHLALCYIKNQDNCDSSEILKYFQEKLIGKTVEFESVNFYPSQDQEKITLINL